MTNEEALTLLQEYADALHTALETTAFAKAMLTFPGEATWDSVKSVASSAGHLNDLGRRIQALPDVFEDIFP